MTFHFGRGRQGQGHGGGEGHPLQRIEENDGADGEDVGDILVGVADGPQDSRGHRQLLQRKGRGNEREVTLIWLTRPEARERFLSLL